jgi:pyruvate/2-oxoglutarate dehydrogenase complex dihydrolipoamide acyltransferase (E2) component
MDLKMKMPDLATTDSAIKVIRWLVAPGQPIKRGEALLEVETDKATMEVECIATGIFKEGRAQPGDTLLAGQILAVIEVEGPARPVASEPAAAEPVAPETPPMAPPFSSPSPVATPKAAGGMFAKNRSAAGAKPRSPT